MASSTFRFPTTVNNPNYHRSTLPNYSFSTTGTFNLVVLPSRISLHRSFPFKRNFRLGHCRASSSPSDPPPENDPPPVSGSDVTPKDTLQIFFAVLFWMSLFFWSSAWDGGNSGKPNKGSRFRK